MKVASNHDLNSLRAQFEAHAARNEHGQTGKNQKAGENQKCNKGQQAQAAEGAGEAEESDGSDKYGEEIKEISAGCDKGIKCKKVKSEDRQKCQDAKTNSKEQLTKAGQEEAKAEDEVNSNSDAADATRGMNFGKNSKNGGPQGCQEQGSGNDYHQNRLASNWSPMGAGNEGAAKSPAGDVSGAMNNNVMAPRALNPRNAGVALGNANPGQLREDLGRTQGDSSELAGNQGELGEAQAAQAQKNDLLDNRVDALGAKKDKFQGKEKAHESAQKALNDAGKGLGNASQGLAQMAQMLGQVSQMLAQTAQAVASIPFVGPAIAASLQKASAATGLVAKGLDLISKMLANSSKKAYAGAGKEGQKKEQNKAKKLQTQAKQLKTKDKLAQGKDKLGNITQDKLKVSDALDQNAKKQEDIAQKLREQGQDVTVNPVRGSGAGDVGSGSQAGGKAQKLARPKKSAPKSAGNTAAKGAPAKGAAPAPAKSAAPAAQPAQTQAAAPAAPAAAQPTSPQPAAQPVAQSQPNNSGNKDNQNNNQGNNQKDQQANKVQDKDRAKAAAKQRNLKNKMSNMPKQDNLQGGEVQDNGSLSVDDNRRKDMERQIRAAAQASLAGGTNGNSLQTRNEQRKLRSLCEGAQNMAFDPEVVELAAKAQANSPDGPGVKLRAMDAGQNQADQMNGANSGNGNSVGGRGLAGGLAQGGKMNMNGLAGLKSPMMSMGQAPRGAAPAQAVAAAPVATGSRHA